MAPISVWSPLAAWVRTAASTVLGSLTSMRTRPVVPPPVRPAAVMVASAGTA